MTTETVRRWLANDQNLYHAASATVRECGRADNPAEALEELVREYVDADLLVGLTQDLVRSALDGVDWDQVAEDFTHE